MHLLHLAVLIVITVTYTLILTRTLPKNSECKNGENAIGKVSDECIIGDTWKGVAIEYSTEPKNSVNEKGAGENPHRTYYILLPKNPVIYFIFR